MFACVVPFFFRFLFLGGPLNKKHTHVPSEGCEPTEMQLIANTQKRQIGKAWVRIGPSLETDTSQILSFSLPILEWKLTGREPNFNQAPN